MAKYDFIFVDESGDPGYEIEPDTGELLSSRFYIAAALHLCDDSFPHFAKHLAAFRYFTQLTKELRLPPEKEVYARLMGPVNIIAQSGGNVCATAVYVTKPEYSGPYLKPGGKKP